jgi:hypothetical protein
MALFTHRAVHLAAAALGELFEHPLKERFSRMWRRPMPG